MSIRRRGRLGLLTGAAAAALLVLPGAVFANTNPQIAATGGMTATLPLLGSSLTVVVTLDAVGNVSNVSLDPVGTYSATDLSAHAVRFENSEGTAQVSVKAKGDRLSISAAAGTLADLLGAGTWSADVFGTGVATVPYTIGDAGDGTPTITIGTVTAPAGVTFTILPTETEDEDGDVEAKARVDFAYGGFGKRLTIKVSVETGDGDDEDGDEPKASLKITLSGKDRQELIGTLTGLFGPHTWSGTLCDGTAVDATFNVAADGTISFVGATGAPVSSEHLGNGVLVRFDGTNVSVTALLVPQEGDLYRLGIRGKSGQCGSHDGTPTVNTPIAPNAACDEAEHDGDEADHDGDEAGDEAGDDHDGGDDDHDEAGDDHDGGDDDCDGGESEN